MDLIEALVEHAHSNAGKTIAVVSNYLSRAGKEARRPAFWVTVILWWLVATAGISVLDKVKPECSVAYAGSTATVELTGLGAGQACQQLIESGAGFTDGPFPGGPPSTTGAAICRLRLNGLTAIVRDRSPYAWTGHLLCAYLKSEGGVQ